MYCLVAVGRDLPIELKTLYRAAQRRAAVRRSDKGSAVVYGCQVHPISERSAGFCKIAVPGGGPAMRGGAAHLDSAQGISGWSDLR